MTRAECDVGLLGFLVVLEGTRELNGEGFAEGLFVETGCG